MDYTTCYCRSPQCPMYGQIAPRAQVKMHDWQRQGPRFRCARCDGHDLEGYEPNFGYPKKFIL